MQLTNSQPSQSLERFVQAQAGDYQNAMRELEQGRKQTHWIWYVLPQLRGLGQSSFSYEYGIAGRAEARRYFEHPVLGPRLRECVAAILSHQTEPIAEILGEIDAMKFRSCLTLFAEVAPEEPLFLEGLRIFYGGAADTRTLALLASTAK